MAALGWNAPAFAAGSVEAGQAKSMTCIACHGADGNSVNPEWPNLAGQHATYIERQLNAFRAGERKNDADVADGHDPLRRGHRRPRRVFPGRRPPPAARPSPRSSPLGQRVYRSGNVSARRHGLCRLPRPERPRQSAGAGYASIQGQHAIYAAAQLRAYRSGERATDPNQMMRNVAALLSDEEIDAVASYVQGLR